METKAYDVTNGTAYLGWNINKHFEVGGIDLSGITVFADASAPCSFKTFTALTIVAHVLLPSLVAPLPFFCA